jgi:UDP-glucose 4-epimerase
MVRVVIELTNCDRAVGEIVNIGSDQPISIAQLAREVLRLFPDSSSSIEMQSYDAAYGAGFEDVRRRVPDLTKLHQLVPPRPQRSLQQTLLELSRHSRERI